jgi:outer membrane receptor protein involved in Fe transport
MTTLYRTPLLSLMTLATSAALAQTPPLAPPQALEPVVVTGARTLRTATRLPEDALRIPFATSVVSREQMDETGAKTLEEALRTVPGLQHGTQGNYFVRFETRGLRDTQDVLTLVDGVPLRLLQGNADLTLLAPDLLERVEFIKGPASALYGKNAIGGVVQFFLKPEEPSGRVNLTVGSFNRRDAALRQRWDFEGGNLFIGLSSSDNDGFQRDTPRKQRAGVVSSDWRFSADWLSGYQVYFSDVRAQRGSIVPLVGGQPVPGIGVRDNFAIPGVYIDGEYLSLAWKNRLRINSEWVLEHLSSSSHYDRLFQGGITILPAPATVNKGYSETTTVDRGLFHDLTLTQTLQGQGWRNRLQLGLNLESGAQDQASPTFSNAPTYRGPDYNTPVTNISNDPRGVRGPVTDSRFDQTVQSLFVNNRLERGAIGLNVGLRHDRFEQTLVRTGTTVQAQQKAQRSSPRVGVDWQLNPEMAAFANWTEGFRPQAVALNTRSGVVVPALLRPEVTRSTELGLKGRDGQDRWTWQVSLFQADKLDGQRSFRTGPDSFVFSNASSRVTGLESQLQLQLAPAWRAYAHYTLQDAKLLDFPTFDANGAPSTNFAGLRVRMSARHLAGAGLSWRQGAWSAQGGVSHVGARPLRDNVLNPQELPGYTLLNVSASWRMQPGLVLQAGVDNLSNRYYINDDFSAQEAGNAGAPRSVFVRLRMSY